MPIRALMFCVRFCSALSRMSGEVACSASARAAVTPSNMSFSCLAKPRTVSTSGGIKLWGGVGWGVGVPHDAVPPWEKRGPRRVVVEEELKDNSQKNANATPHAERHSHQHATTLPA